MFFLCIGLDFLHERIGMSKHFHAIIQIDNERVGCSYVGAGLKPAPTGTQPHQQDTIEIVRALKRFSVG